MIRKTPTVIATTTTTTAAPASVNHTTKFRSSRTNRDRTEETAPLATAGAGYWAIRLRGPAVAPERLLRADLFWYIRRSAVLTSAS